MDTCMILCSSDGVYAGFATAIFVVFYLGLLFFCFAIAAFSMLCNWKIFEKAGEPGWAGLIPIYNYIVYFKICDMNILWLVAVFVPLANTVAAIFLSIKLGQVFGKSTPFIVGLCLLSPIFMGILAFDKSRYLGPNPPGSLSLGGSNSPI